MDFPKFPSDFNIVTFEKSKEEIHSDKLENKLVKKEIERIYQIVMDKENIVIGNYKYTGNQSKINLE